VVTVIQILLLLPVQLKLAQIVKQTRAVLMRVRRLRLHLHLLMEVIQLQSPKMWIRMVIVLKKVKVVEARALHKVQLVPAAQALAQVLVPVLAKAVRAAQVPMT
jgi:hypothetical protein